MSILLDRETPVLVQGITGKIGSFHTKEMMAYGTNIVGGVTPGKGGTSIDGVPVFDTMKEVLTEGSKIKISGFGNFVVREKKERVGRNPQTGAPIPISARRVLTFKPSQVLKTVLNPHKDRLRGEGDDELDDDDDLDEANED